ncbi:MAG: ATP-binding protein [Candidatus Binatia bacterium]
MSRKPIKLLLIDDNPDDRRVYQRYLRNIPDCSYSLWEEETGQKGVAAARTLQADCILVDYYLPDCDGIEVVRQVRNQQDTADTPVIVLTGSSPESIVAAAIRQGASDYLRKDLITQDGLHHAIQQAIEKGALQKTIKAQNRDLAEKNSALENAFAEVQAAREELENRVKKRTSTLQKANEALQLQVRILATMNEGLVVVTEDGRIVLTNAALDAMFGYETGELHGHHINVLTSTAERQTILTAEIFRRLQADKVWRGRVTHYRKDGTRFTAYARISSVDIAGQGYFVSLYEDITEREALEAKVREQERLAHVGTTAVRLTHEIGNRLNGLSTSVQLLERQLFRAPKLELAALRETVADLKGETDRMTKFLQDLRTLARAYRLNIAPFDLVSLIQEVLRIYEPVCLRNGITIVQPLSSSLTPVLADRERCSEVLHHLLSNAVEAMPHGGMLTIGAGQTSQWLRITIHDTGPGIPEGIDIFAPFISTKPGGTGLGLTIALQLVVAQRGTLTFASSGNQGTTFILELPTTTTSSQPADSSQEAVAPSSPINHEPTRASNDTTTAEQSRSALASRARR